MLRVFAASGVPAYFQPLKNILRWRMQGGEAGWVLPHLPGGMIYLKETLGPYTQAEAAFNPLQVLLQAGLPPERCSLLILGRAPLDVWASWKHWWRDCTSLDLLALAYQTTERIRQQAHQAQIPVTSLVYEALRDNPPKRVVRGLFARLGIKFQMRAVQGWQGLPAFGAAGSNIILPVEPPRFITPDIHTSVERAGQLRFYARPDRFSTLSPYEIDQIVAAGLPEIYTTWRRACEHDLNLEVVEQAPPNQ